MYIKVEGLKRDSLISGYSYNYYCFNACDTVIVTARTLSDQQI